MDNFGSGLIFVGLLLIITFIEVFTLTKILTTEEYYAKFRLIASPKCDDLVVPHSR